MNSIPLKFSFLAMSALGLFGCGGASAPAPTPVIAYAVGGTVRGLNGSLVLQNNTIDELIVGINGAFQFNTKVPDRGAYNVTIKTQPANQRCSLTNGAGVIAGSNVAGVAIVCVSNPSDTAFDLSVIVSGLDGNSVALRNNGANDLNASGSASFGRFVSGTQYSITVKAQPSYPASNCIIGGGLGTIANAAVVVRIDCVPLAIPTVIPNVDVFHARTVTLDWSLPAHGQ